MPDGPLPPGDRPRRVGDLREILEPYRLDRDRDEPQEQLNGYDGESDKPDEP